MVANATRGTRLPLLSHFLGLALLVLATACGGGGGGTPHDTSAKFGLNVAALSVPRSAVDTVTVQIDRTAGYTGSVAFSIGGTLPNGIKANFASSSTTGNSVELTIEAGYPDPADPTFATTVLPAIGTYPITIKGTSPADTVTTTLNLTVRAATGEFSVGLVAVDGTNATLDTQSALTIHQGQDLALNIAAYNSGLDGANYPSTSVTFSTLGLPTGLTVILPTGSLSLDHVYAMTIHADAALPAGDYGFSIGATVGGVTQYLPLCVTNAAGYFWIKPEHAVSVQQGATLIVPAELGHDDTFFVDKGGTDPAYTGVTNLAVLSAPAGITASFSDSNPTAFATTQLSITAAADATPGTATLTLQATRNATTTTVDVPVTVTRAVDTPAVWVQRVEWGQTILSGDLRLIPAKPALLRVHLLADRTGVTAPAVSATIKNASGTTLDTVTLTGPALVPTNVHEGTLAATFTAVLPAADIVHGMKVELSVGGVVQEIVPTVETTGFNFDLTVVPIIHKGLVPVLPADADVAAGLKAYWPLQAVTITHRAPYTTATVVPAPKAAGASGDYSSDGWSELITEVSALKIADGADSSYFGYFDADLGSLATGVSSIVGLHYVGYGAGLAIDVTTAGYFGGYDTCIETTVHELGHGFNLNHSPAGGAGGPQMNYPYLGASIGSYGYDPVALKLYLPSTTKDIMGYQGPYWTSDWNYRIVQDFVESAGSFLNHAQASVATADHLVVTGWIGPDGQAHLSPISRLTCRASSPAAGPMELTLVSASGTRSVTFAPYEIGCLPKGYKAFAFTVPAGEDLDQVELRQAGRVLLHRTAPARRAGAAPVILERDGRLHITWDAAADPIVSVVHEVDGRSTVLALRLTGGSADLPLEGLPKGGRFVVRGGDGMNHRKPVAAMRANLD